MVPGVLVSLFLPSPMLRLHTRAMGNVGGDGDKIRTPGAVEADDLGNLGTHSWTLYMYPVPSCRGADPTAPLHSANMPPMSWPH